jgi:hypothetical protein
MSLISLVCSFLGMCLLQVKAIFIRGYLTVEIGSSTTIGWGEIWGQSRFQQASFASNQNLLEKGFAIDAKVPRY